MKKALLFIGVLAASFTQAQVLYVNNSNGTYQAIDTQKVGDIIFEESEQVIYIELGDRMCSQFATSKITNIAPTSNNGTELIPNTNPTVAFNAADKDNFNEITQEIPTNELDDEYGDFVENYSTSRIITITFSENGVKTSSLPSGITATINGGHIVINSTLGKIGYQLKGTCNNGSFKIYSDKKFRLLFNGITLTNPTGPAINIQSGKTVYASIVNGTTNTLCDGATYNNPVIGSDGEEEDQKGTIFSEGQLLINGNGTLNVTSLGGHGICSDDYIRVRSGKINIESLKDGFHTNDLFRLGRTEKYSPVITVKAGGDAIDCGKGYVLIEAGKMLLNSEGEGIKASYEEETPDPTITPDVTIAGGFVKIETTGSKSSAIKATGNYAQRGGAVQAKVSGDGSKVVNADKSVAFAGGKLTGVATGAVETVEITPAGGIKCAGDLAVTGGEIALKCTGTGSKAINCDGNITVEGGSARLLTEGEDYHDADGYKRAQGINCNNLTMNNGVLVVDSKQETLATSQVTMSGGTIQLTNADSGNPEHFGWELQQTGGWLVKKYQAQQN